MAGFLRMNSPSIVFGKPTIFVYNNGSNGKKRDVFVLCENLKAIRKSKGLSQQALAVKLNVVRQTVSKWEQGGSRKLMSCGMISIDGKLFMNRVEKMKHIAIIVLTVSHIKAIGRIQAL